MSFPLETDVEAIRQADRADLLDVYHIEKSSFEEPWPFAAFERFLGEPGFLVATCENQVAGFVIADTVTNYGQRVGHIKDIAVQPEARGQGLGRGLLHQALVVLTINDASHVKLEVRESNDAAQHLYDDVGFQPMRRANRYYEDGEDALVMVLDLDDWQRQADGPDADT